MLKYIVDSGLILGAITIFLILTFRARSSRNNIFLALSLTSIWYGLLINNLNQTQEMIHYPFLFRTGNISGYLILGFLYIYARNTFYPGIFWRKRDWILIIPSAFYIIDMFPVFLLPAETKIAIMKSNFLDPRLINQVSEGWIAYKGFHNLFRYIWALTLLSLLIRLVIRNRYFARDANNPFNRRLFWFIVILTLLRIPLIFPGILGAVFNHSWFSLSFLSMDLAVVLITTSLYFLVTPTILYGFFPIHRFQKNPDMGNAPITDHQITENKEPDIPISHQLFIKDAEAETERISSKIESHMQKNLPFLNTEYNIHDLGRDVHVPVYQLSPIINQHFKMNFSSWINKYRVEHFISLCEDYHNKELTLEALAKESGFSNRTTFINAFKKEKNMTPGVFLKDYLANIPLSQ
jgi:AraC-like DNA-binding protein